MNFEANGVGSWGSVSENMSPRVGGVNAGVGQGASVSGQPTNSAAVKTESAKSGEDAGEKLAAEMNVFNTAASDLRSAMNREASFEERVSNLMLAAADLFGLAPTWTAFYREVLGAEGLVRTCVMAGEEMSAFECSAEHAELLTMLTTLRSRDLPENDPFEQQRMITVRIPKSLHDSICAEANDLQVSVNKLCISRMLQKLDPAMVPACGQKRRGRRPGGSAAKEATADVAPDAQVISMQVSSEVASSMFIRTNPVSGVAESTPFRDVNRGGYMSGQ